MAFKCDFLSEYGTVLKSSVESPSEAPPTRQERIRGVLTNFVLSDKTAEVATYRRVGVERES